jgi:hypothetical protein
VLVFDVLFPGPGSYRFVIAVDGEELGSVPVTASQLLAAPPPAAGVDPHSSS